MNGPTQEFTLFERGRVRPITSIQIRDRIIRHVLCDEVLLPEVKKHIIYDNCASIKGRGISHQRDRFEVHLRKYYRLYGNEGWILFGDFSKFYDNIIHEIAKRELLKLFDDDEFIDWLLTQIFDGFKIDVSYMTDEEYATCMSDTFNKLDYRNIPESKLTGEKWMEKSVNIGDQLSQVIGIYYPYRIDNYVKYVRSQKFYGRYMDDWYIMNPSKEELFDLLDHILKSPIHQVVLNGKDIPKKIHHEFLRCFLPLAGFDRNLVSSIQIVGVTDNLLIVHKSFTVIAILTVVNCVRLCYLSIRKGQCLLLCWLSRESGRTPPESEALL